MRSSVVASALLHHAYTLCAAQPTTNLTQNCPVGTAIIKTQSDAALLSSCWPSFDGYIVVSSFNGDLDLGPIQKIGGNLTIMGNQELRSVIASKLSSIQGSLNVGNLTSLETLSMPNLTNAGNVYLSSLPKLSTVQFKQALITNNVVMTDTALTSPPDFMQTVALMEISNNTQMSSVNLSIESATRLVVGMNGSNLTAFMPNLTTATIVKIKGVSQLDLPTLQSVQRDMLVSDNDFERLSLPSLVSIDFDLQISNNSRLEDLSLPLFQSIGGDLKVQGNPSLRDVPLSKLSNVGGVMNLNGTFSSLTIPEIASVQGDMNIWTTDKFSCDPLIDYKEKGVIKGSLSCMASNTNPSTLDSSSSGHGKDPKFNEGNAAPKTGMPREAKIAIGVAVPLVAILAISVFLAIRRKQRNVQKQEMILDERPCAVAEVPRGGHHEKTELAATENCRELSTIPWGSSGSNVEAHELQADSRRHELA